MTDTNQTSAIRIAEWCGWMLDDDGNWLTPDGFRTSYGLPSYLTDLNACAEFEELLGERGLEAAYLDAIFRVMGVIRKPNPLDYMKAILHATPAQRCAAMEAVLKDNPDAGPEVRAKLINACRQLYGSKAGREKFEAGKKLAGCINHSSL